MQKTRKRLSIIGAGNVGATAAHWAASRNLADVVLFDIVEGFPQGKALDLSESAPISGMGVDVIGTNAYADTADSDVVIITAGSPRKPGMSRDDLLMTNHKIIADVAANVVKYSPDAILIVVTNPVDIMTYLAWKASELPSSRVIGQAGVLDSTRFCTFVAQELGVSPLDVSAFVLGGHGDAMVPLTRYAYVGGVPVEQLIPRARLDEIVERTRKGGGEIVNLLKTSSAFYAPGASVVKMAEAILYDRKRVLPAIAHLDGEYGQRDIYVGVPVILGAGGVERVIEVQLTQSEKAAFERSVASVREPLSALYV